MSHERVALNVRVNQISAHQKGAQISVFSMVIKPFNVDSIGLSTRSHFTANVFACVSFRLIHGQNQVVGNRMSFFELNVPRCLAVLFIDVIRSDTYQ